MLAILLLSLSFAGALAAPLPQNNPTQSGDGTITAGDWAAYNNAAAKTLGNNIGGGITGFFHGAKEKFDDSLQNTKKSVDASNAAAAQKLNNAKESFQNSVAQTNAAAANSLQNTKTSLHNANKALHASIANTNAAAAANLQKTKNGVQNSNAAVKNWFAESGVSAAKSLHNTNEAIKNSYPYQSLAAMGEGIHNSNQALAAGFSNAGQTFSAGVDAQTANARYKAASAMYRTRVAIGTNVQDIGTSINGGAPPPVAPGGKVSA